MTTILERHVWDEIKQDLRVRSFQARSGQGNLDERIWHDIGTTRKQFGVPFWPLFG